MSSVAKFALKFNKWIQQSRKNILYHLQKAVTLPEYDELPLRGSTFLHDQQEEIGRLMALFDIQHQADYTTSKFNASKFTMLAHLAQRQAIELLNLNIRLVEAYQQIDAKIEENTVNQILRSQHAMRVQMEQVLHSKALQISNVLVATQEKINHYDVDDMRNILQSQKETFQDLANQNADLVAEKSKLRMHLSFIPVQHRDFAASNKQSVVSHARRDPK
jgi:hypothetical protein